ERDRRRPGLSPNRWPRVQILLVQQLRVLSSCLPGQADNTSMIKTPVLRASPIVLHFRGELDMKDLLALADALAREQASRPSSSILFDWSNLGSWNFKTPAKPEIQGWLRGADLIVRLGIVHHLRGNRQCA